MAVLLSYFRKVEREIMKYRDNQKILNNVFGSNFHSYNENFKSSNDPFSTLIVFVKYFSDLLTKLL